MKTELRSINVELRSSGPMRLEGYGAVFGAVYQVGDFSETIRAGAFSNVMNDDVRCLLNHNVDKVLGRTTSGTMRIAQDGKGLHYEVDLPDCDVGRDVWRMVNRGDITGSSFSFAVGEEEFSADHREIVSLAHLYDVGPVSFPAYTETSVAARHNSQRRFGSVGTCNIDDNLDLEHAMRINQILRLSL